MNNLKVIFMGTPEFSLPVLEGLNSKYNVVMVVCQRDKPSNRAKIEENITCKSFLCLIY